MAFSSVYNWRLPDGPVAADGPDALADLAFDIESTLLLPDWKPYNPNWGSDNQQPANPATKIGRYRLASSWCDFRIYMSFGPNSNGGKGNLNLSLPINASNALPEQLCHCKLWNPGSGVWNGNGEIRGGTSIVWPMFTTGDGNVTLNYWRNNNDNNDPGTGFPTIPGQWTVGNGGNIVISGRYLTV